VIQRIQTIHLLIASLITGICAYLVYDQSELGEPYNFLVEIPLEVEISLRFLESSLLVTSFLSFIVIFLFKFRKTQLFFCSINQLLLFGIFLVMLYFTIDVDFRSIPYQQLLVLITPLFSVTFIALAIRGIKNDRALIKSMDRLR